LAHRDGVYQRGNAWWLHFCYQGERYEESLGRGITRKVAKELAQVRRAAILRVSVALKNSDHDESGFDPFRDRLMHQVARHWQLVDGRQQLPQQTNRIANGVSFCRG
jgi:hypothetical protein